MTISERLFEIMKEKNISMPELSRMTGISRHTIYDWHKKNTNPGADKIQVICEALRISPTELLIGSKDGSTDVQTDLEPDEVDAQIIQMLHEMSETQKRRLLAYMSMLQNIKNDR
jgi:transcriptional regulator with XRE-family HTH domain